MGRRDREALDDTTMYRNYKMSKDIFIKNFFIRVMGAAHFS